jgi:head-tail adaptor
MLTTAEIDGMRLTLDSSLPDFCTITSRVLTADIYGGSTDSWVTGLTVSCRLAPRSLSDGEREQAGAELAVGNWLVTMPALTVVATTDRLIIDGRTFEVLQVLDRRTFELHTACHCQEIL